MKKKNVLKVFFSVLTVFLALTCTLASIKTKKIKADTVSDLTNTTWIINDEPSTFPSGRDFTNYYNDETDGPYNINFTSNNINFTSITFVSDEDIACHMRYNEGNTRYWVLTYGDSNDDTYVWLNNNYKTIVITGGTDTTNLDLISWFETNATQQTPTPSGTEITHKYWASYGDMIMTTNQIVGDNDISYTVLLNSYTNEYNEETLTGLAFTGVLENYNNYSYTISPTNEDILYQGTTNNIDNPLLLEFTTGDYMDSDLYELMSDNGVWFDDARVYMAGTSFGSIYGFNRGRAYGQAEGLEYTNLLTTILNSIGSLLSIQIFPHITIALILGLPLLLGVFIIIIKILRG